MSEKTVDQSDITALDAGDVLNVGVPLLGLPFTKILCTLRYGLVICACGAHLLLSACAGGGGGSSESASPSSPPPPTSPPPPDSSPTKPDDPSPDQPDSAPSPPSAPPPPSGSPPSGPLSIPLGSSVEHNLAPVEHTTLRLGGAFGAGPDLGRVVVIDSLGRPHWIDLDGRTSAAEAGLDLMDWLSASNQEFRLSGRVTPQFALGLNFSAREVSDSEDRRYRNDEFANGFALTADLDGARLSLLRDWGIERHFGFSAEVPSEDYNLMATSRFALPYVSLMGTGDGLVVAREVRENALSLRLGFATERSPRFSGARGDAKVWVGEVIGRLSNNSWIGLQLGSTLERNRLLGSEGNGAFELPSTSTTHFMGLAGSLSLTDRLELFGQGSVGFTDPAGSEQHLIEEISALRSSSFGFGITHREVLAANDRLTVAISQPLRVDAGTAVFDRAIGWSLDGRFLRQRERISLEPEGRETDIEVGYLFPLGRNANMSLNWLSQLEPGHDRDASPAHTLALKLRVKF